MKLGRYFLLLSLGILISSATAQTGPAKRHEKEKDTDLSTSKVLREPALGSPQDTNSLPVTAALSPDGKYLALLNNGFGSAQSNYQQSIAVLDLATNQLHDFPDSRLSTGAKQTYFIGLAWSADGAELYASIASLTDPEAKKPKAPAMGLLCTALSMGI